MPLILLTILLVTPLPALASEALLGAERWRFDLGGKLVAQPAISPGGQVALLTERALVVLEPTGAFVAAHTDAKLPSQPFWQGEALWYRTAAGWAQAGTERRCEVQAQSGWPGVDGRPLFAPPREVVACGESRAVVATRRGGEGQLFRVGDGWAVADVFTVDFLSAQFQGRGQRSLPEWGSPTTGGDAGLFVTTPSGRVDLADVRGGLVWKGFPAPAGVPVPTRAGGVLLLGDRGVTLVQPPRETWSLPVAAGVRVAAALESGDFALLERTGRIGIVREGRLVWGRALRDATPILAAHPSGFLLVQEGTVLRALAAPPAESSSVQDRCAPPAPPVVAGKTLRIQGFAVGAPGCQGPRLELACARDKCAGAGRIAWAQECGVGCASAPAGDAVVLADAGGLRRIDRKGRVRRVAPKLAPSAEAPRIGAAADGRIALARGRELASIDARGTVTTRELGAPWVAGPVLLRNEIAGLDADLRIVAVRRGEAREVPVALGPLKGAQRAELLAFGETVCAEAPDRAGCAADGRPLPPLSLAPRALLFGQEVRTCEDRTALCLWTPAASEPETLFWKAGGRVDALVSIGDGTVAAFVDGRRVVALGPDGAPRWTAQLGSGDARCEGGWVARLAPNLVAAQACGRVVGIETGLAAP
jgi:hypothetical protein